MDAATETVILQKVTRMVPDIIARSDAGMAHRLACATVANRTPILPELMMLFNTAGLNPVQKRDMAQAVYAHVPPAVTTNAPKLAHVGARLGALGFSFPQWRYLTQTFNGASLVERYGMVRLNRPTDMIDASLPDPQRDLFGTGFVHREGSVSIEYRRAYILCSEASEKHSAALIVRNNSHFFGRDRLPEAVYVSWESFAPGALDNLTPADLHRFLPWQDITRTEHRLTLSERLRRVGRLLDTTHDFDMKLNLWLRNPKGDGGLHPMLDFLRSKIDGHDSMKLPFLGAVRSGMPPWFPGFALPVTRDLIDDLSRDGAPIPMSERSVKMVLLSGQQGDFPWPRSGP